MTERADPPRAAGSRHPTGRGPADARIRLLGRAGCHLCDVARDVVEVVARESGTRFVEVDVDDDPGLGERYGDLVPVVLVDGVEHSHWRVDADELRAALG